MNRVSAKEILDTIFSLTDGTYKAYVNYEEIAEALAVESKLLWSQILLLKDQGLISIRTMDGMCGLSAEGFQIASGEVTENPKYPSIFVNQMVNSQIQQNSHGSSQVLTVDDSDKEELKKISAEILKAIQASKSSELEKELAESHVMLLKQQLAVPPQNFDLAIFKLTWDKLARFSDIATVTPLLADGLKYIANLI